MDGDCPRCGDALEAGVCMSCEMDKRAEERVEEERRAFRASPIEAECKSCRCIGNCLLVYFDNNGHWLCLYCRTQIFDGIKDGSLKSPEALSYLLRPMGVIRYRAIGMYEYLGELKRAHAERKAV